MNALRAVVTSERVEIYRDAAPDRPIVVQRTPANGRPFIHPIVAPDGRGELTEDAPPHHPWQHGLYVGLNDVNGVGFWTEGLLTKNAAADGKINALPPSVLAHRDGRFSWVVASHWMAPDGGKILDEVQEWTFADRGDTYLLDLCWTLASAKDVRFGQYAYGGLFLRMPFRAQAVGRAISSEGRTDAQAEGRRARWVAVSMPVPGRPPNDPAGIAILDHPTNPEHPTPWRVDHELGICPSRCIAGGWTLPPYERAVSRYRLLVFTKATDSASVEAEWRAFAELGKWEDR